MPLACDRLRRAVVDHVARRAVGRFADEHAVHRRGRLEARGGVDHVAGGHRLAQARVGVERDEGLAGVDGDPHLEAALGRGGADRERGAHGPLGVVLVRDGGAEERHHRVADELLDRAAERLELAAQPLVVGAEDRLDVLRVERLRMGREADEVGEDDGDDLALAACHGPSLRRRP